jgi:hypothetical protein
LFCLQEPSKRAIQANKAALPCLFYGRWFFRESCLVSTLQSLRSNASGNTHSWIWRTHHPVTCRVPWPAESAHPASCAFSSPKVGTLHVEGHCAVLQHRQHRQKQINGAFSSPVPRPKLCQPNCANQTVHGAQHYQFPTSSLNVQATLPQCACSRVPLQ